MSRAEELKAKIQEAKDAYYNLNPIVTDQQFDAWVDELRRLDASNPELASVGASPPQFSVWEKVRHEIPMGSLGKANSVDEIREWAEKTGASTFFVANKIDGSSMELVYDGGKLIRCVTRGDGNVGEDVTANVSRIPSVPKEIPVPGHLVVRGEVVMMKDVFAAKYSGEYANPRNTAAAFVREKKGGGERCLDLEFIAYWANDRLDSVTFDGLFSGLRQLGMKVPEPTCMSGLNGVIGFFDEVRNARGKIPYEIDGLVVSVGRLEDLEELGEHNLRPRGQIAWKFDAAMCETKVVDVRWQVGPTGRITPVAVLDPVSLGGVVVTNVSLHNLILFQELKLFPGCRVLVSRRNDVIPYIEQNLDA